MPRYSYQCSKCDHVYEKVEGWDAKPQQRCPECKGKAQRIFQPPAIVFKGSGFYSTDNRHSSFSRDEEREAEAPPAAAATEPAAKDDHAGHGHGDAPAAEAPGKKIVGSSDQERAARVERKKGWVKEEPRRSPDEKAQLKQIREAAKRT